MLHTAIIPIGETPTSADRALAPIDMLADLGLPVNTLPAVKRARKVATTLGDLLDAKLSMNPPGRERAIQALGARLDSGDVTLEDLPLEALKADAATAWDGTARRAVDAAIRIRENRVYDEIRSVGEEIVVQHIRPAVEKLVREITERSALVPAETGVLTEMPPTSSIARSAWFAIEEVVTRLEGLRNAGLDLIAMDLVTVTGTSGQDVEPLVWEHPERLPTGIRNPASDTRWLLDRLDARPTLKLQSELEPAPVSVNAADFADFAGVS